ncbi:hypothetical protein ABWU93_11575 [Xanthomonas translucens pv. translucens]|uniref:hypothetical protein n=1 Tax=Xanthomonas campestris pv. translucens TaxID=343 RepID=UPI003F72A866
MTDPMNEHFITLGRISAIESALRALINSAERPSLLCAQIRDDAEGVVADLRRQNQPRSDLVAQGIEAGIAHITA